VDCAPKGLVARLLAPALRNKPLGFAAAVQASAGDHNHREGGYKLPPPIFHRWWNLCFILYFDFWFDNASVIKKSFFTIFHFVIFL
jgi:hypothetical protein